MQVIPPIFVAAMRLALYGIGIALGVTLAGSQLGDPWGFVALCALAAAAVASWPRDERSA